MNLEVIILIFSTFMAIGIVVQPFLVRFHIPFAATLLVIGFLGSELITGFGFSLEIDYSALHSLVIYLFLPILMFAATFRLDTTTLGKDKPPWWVALFMAFTSFLIIAAILFILINHTGFPWIIALMTAALLMPTDPMVMLRYRFLKPGSSRLLTLLQVEGLVHTAIGVVLFLSLSYIASHPEEIISLMDIVIQLIWVFIGELVLGLLGSLVAIYLSRCFQTAEQQALVAITMTYLVYMLASVTFNLSGVITAMTIGYFYGRATRVDFSRTQEIFQERFWSLIDHTFGAMIYLLMGIAFTIDIFQQRWLAILFGIIAIVIARLVQMGVYDLTLRFTAHAASLTREEQALGIAGGLRGAITLALALSIPVTIPSWWTVQAIAFGVVAFSLLVQTPVFLKIASYFRNGRERA